jgi:hypothetical protein
MKKDDVINQLANIGDEDQLSSGIESLVLSWENSNVGLDAVEPILRFMEDHPDWDYGMPGAFVHYMESFYGSGYESKLIESIERRPIMHTIWMLNRLINGEKDSVQRKRYVNLLSSVKDNKYSDAETVEFVDELLAKHASDLS